jgi:aminoglycoside/choline kinase family phosphotransferase
VRVTGAGRFAAKAERMTHIRDFLAEHGLGEAMRKRIQGDASTRVYERLMRGTQSLVLMNAPRRPDGPPVRDGKPYSAIAHLAESVTPFIAVAHGLSERGFSAPRIIAADREAGLIVLEDLGSALVVSGEPPAPIEERYAAATDALAALHGLDLPELLPVEAGLDYQLPGYDMQALLIEAELLLDWYLPKFNATISAAGRENFLAHWRSALTPALDAPATWVLRDYHSPNLLWLPEREGVARVGLLDFQDAVMGPAAYDVASLLQDARVDVPETMEIALLTRYTRARRAADPAFDARHFAQLYATMAAQRASKILGIFARLEKRDRKPQYLRHMPRVWAYLRRALAHPALEPLQSWYRTHVPALRT